jgi:hypothetical protein
MPFTQHTARSKLYNSIILLETEYHDWTFCFLYIQTHTHTHTRNNRNVDHPTVFYVKRNVTYKTVKHNHLLKSNNYSNMSRLDTLRHLWAVSTNCIKDNHIKITGQAMYVLYNGTLGHVRVTIVAVEKQ